MLLLWCLAPRKLNQHLMRKVRKRKQGEQEREREKPFAIPEERKSKRMMLKLVEEFSSSKADDEVSAIAIDLINIVDTSTTLATPTTRSARVEKRIIISEPTLEKPSPKKVPAGKGKKKQKEASIAPSQDSTPSPIRKARREA